MTCGQRGTRVFWLSTCSNVLDGATSLWEQISAEEEGDATSQLCKSNFGAISYHSHIASKGQKNFAELAKSLKAFFDKQGRTNYLNRHEKEGYETQKEDTRSLSLSFSTPSCRTPNPLYLLIFKKNKEKETICIYVSCLNLNLSYQIYIIDADLSFCGKQKIDIYLRRSVR